MNWQKIMAVAGLLSGVALAAVAVDVPLEYVREGDERTSQHLGGSQSVAAKPTPPKGDWQWPEFLHDKPLYAQFTLADSEVLVVLDCQTNNGAYYDRLFVDANFNRDLTDDKPLTGELMGQDRGDIYWSRFPATDCIIRSDNTNRPYSFWVQVFARRPTRQLVPAAAGRSGEFELQVMLQANCHYLGQLEVDSVPYKVALGDQNGNGLFTDRFSIPDGIHYANKSIFARGDAFYLSATGAFHSGEMFILGSRLLANQTLFEVQPDIPAGVLRLAVCTNALAPLVLSAPANQMTLSAADGSDCLMIRTADTNLAIPKGSYQLASYNLERQDEWGDVWALRGAGTTEGPVIDVGGTHPAVLDFGEPYTMEVAANWRTTMGQAPAMRLGLEVVGRASEAVSQVRHVQGRKTEIPRSKRSRSYPLEPTYKITTLDGELVAQGNFEYG